MLLVHFTMNGEIHKLSNQALDLESPYDPYIFEIDDPYYKIRKDYGGVVELSFGSMEISPTFFVEQETWPPPVSCAITMKYTATTEAEAQTLFSGTAHISNISRTGIKYGLFEENYETEIEKATGFNDTLVNVFTWACHEDRLNLTLDASKARSPSPTVLYTSSTDLILLDFMSASASFFSHLFYIEDGTLYLIDMLGDNGSRTLDEYDFLPSEYEYDTPTKQITALTFSKSSDYAYGNTIEFSDDNTFHTQENRIQPAIENILNILNSPQANLQLPMSGTLPKPGEKISFTDTSLGVDTQMYIRARGLRYDFDEEFVLIEGEGEIS